MPSLRAIQTQPSRPLTREEFDRAVNRIAPRLLKATVNLTGDPAAAEALMRQGLLTAFSRIEEFNPRASFLAWVYSNIHARCLAQLQHQPPAQSKVGRRQRLHRQRVRTQRTRPEASAATDA